MNNDMNNPTNHDSRTSCEEFYTEDMGPATWANEPEPSYKEQHGRCEDAPCCGCCGPYGDDFVENF